MADRTTARVVGVLFIVGTAAGVLAGVVQQPLLDVDGYLVEVASNEGRMATGVLLELVMGLAIMGIVVALYPVLRRYSERMALGFAVARTIEGVTYGLSIIAALTVMSVSGAFVEAGASAGSELETVGRTLLDGREWSNYVFQIVVFAVSAIFLNAVLYRARLVPRWLSLWGLIAAVPYFSVGVLVMYGLEPFSTAQVLLVAPLAVQEMAFALWLIIRGFTMPRPELVHEAEREMALT